MSRPPGRPRRVMHVVYSFHVGGLENVIVQLINRLPQDRYQHHLVSLTDMGAFVDRLQNPHVTLTSLHKPPGHAIPLYPRLLSLLRNWRPDVLHTCNLAALEVVPLAWLCGVPSRIHAEHGWDVNDPDGSNRKLQRVRKLYRPFVSHHVAVSEDLMGYLERAIGVPEQRRSLIANGVDTEIFAPLPSGMQVPDGCPFDLQKHRMIGTVGRMQTVKNQPLLARAFVQLLRLQPELADSVRLVLVGDGPLRAEVESILDDARIRHLAWLPGARSDVADLLRALTCFVLPSDTEGTSCTLQEAMSCGVPVVATAVGGTPALLQQGRSGRLVPPGDSLALAQALKDVLADPGPAQDLARVARAQALTQFSVDAMVARYDELFQIC